MLTERRRRFVEHYVATGNGAEAARLAGFGEPAKQSAYQVLTDMDVREAIAERAADAAIANELSPEWVISRFMTHAQQQENGPLAVSALRELGRHLQLFTDHVTVSDVRTRAVELAQANGVDPDDLEGLTKQLLEGKE